MSIRSFILIAALSVPFATHAAEPAWTELSAQLYDGRALQDGSSLIAIDSPYRTDNDARTRIAVEVAAPPGLNLGRVTLILDENPMPVSADFAFDAPLPRFFFDVTMRINGPTPMHVVAETTDNQLFVAEAFVKTSGQGACAAPPGTDPKLALATLGDMTIGIGDMPGGDVLALRDRRVDVDISHPSLSGMQMDQITLLFIPMRYVEKLDVDLDGKGYVDVTGSISLSENPRISMSAPGSLRRVDVTMTDTDGTVTHATHSVAGY